MPELLRERPLPIQAVAAAIVPVIFGAVTGWMLGVSEAVYVILSILGIGGGYFAGMEHSNARTGAIRGLFGGALFGSSILLVHEATGAEAKAHLQEPEIILVGITTAFGVGLGALGGHKREQLEKAGETDRPISTSTSWACPSWCRPSARRCSSGRCGCRGLPRAATARRRPRPPAATPPRCSTPRAGWTARSASSTRSRPSPRLPLMLFVIAFVPGLVAWMMARGAQARRAGRGGDDRRASTARAGALQRHHPRAVRARAPWTCRCSTATSWRSPARWRSWSRGCCAASRAPARASAARHALSGDARRAGARRNFSTARCVCAGRLHLRHVAAVERHVRRTPAGTSSRGARSRSAPACPACPRRRAPRAPVRRGGSRSPCRRGARRGRCCARRRRRRRGRGG